MVFNSGHNQFFEGDLAVRCNASRAAPNLPRMPDPSHTLATDGVHATSRVPSCACGHAWTRLSPPAVAMLRAYQRSGSPPMWKESPYASKAGGARRRQSAACGSGVDSLPRDAQQSSQEVSSEHEVTCLCRCLTLDRCVLTAQSSRPRRSGSTVAALGDYLVVRLTRKASCR